MNTTTLSKRVALCWIVLSVDALAGCGDIDCPLGSVQRNGYCLEVEALEDGGPRADQSQESTMASARREREQSEEKASDNAGEPEANAGSKAKASGGAGAGGSGSKSGANSGGKSGAGGGEERDGENDDEEPDSSASAGKSGSGSTRKSGSAGKGGSGAKNNSGSDDAADSDDSASDDEASEDGSDDAKSSGGSGSNGSGSKSSGSGGKSGASDDNMSKEPEPPPADPECEGHGGETVCDGRNMIVCNDDAQVADTNACKTEAQCEAGLDAGECGTCDPGTYKCEGKQLQVCSAQGRFGKERDCPSAALCSEDNESCDPAACTPGAKMCKDGGVVTCNDDQTGWKEIEHCKSPDLCDSSRKRCNDCKPNDAHCEGDTLMECGADGSGPAQHRCSGDTPRCLGDRCVECTSPNDCKDEDTSDGCKKLTCNMGTGTCGTGGATAKHVQCTNQSGYCDGSGNCVACTKHEHCEKDEECDSRSFTCKHVPMLKLTQHGMSAYTVHVARGVRVTIRVDFNNSYIEGTVRVTGAGNDNCSLFHNTGADELGMPTKPIPQDAKTCTFSAKPEGYDIKIFRDDGISYFECEWSESETSIRVGFEDQTDGTAVMLGHQVNDCNNPTVVVDGSY